MPTAVMSLNIYFGKATLALVGLGGGALPLSLPPRGLSRQQAAEYIGLSATSFDRLVELRQMPTGKRIGGRVVWDRLKIDVAFSELDDDEAAALQWGSLGL